MTQYILRFDDVHPTMNWEKFHALELLCTTYNIKPIIGVIPNNQDKTLETTQTKPDFWPYIKSLATAGWIIAQHGYQHTYRTTHPGILGINEQSEFAGRPYQEQYQDIAKGKEILEYNLQQPITWWMAPAHSFDIATCKALHTLGFTTITDGIALYPFYQHGLTWIPQQLWLPKPMPFGLWTICIHPNTIASSQLAMLEQFIKNHHQSFVNPSLSARQHWLNTPFRFAWYAALHIQQLKKKLLLRNQ